MKLTRRDFIQLSAAQTGLLILPLQAESQTFQNQQRPGPSILQGATDESNTEFNIVHDRNQPLVVYATNSNGTRWNPVRLTVHTMGDHPKSVTKVWFSNLYTKEIFRLHIERSDGQSLDTRTFQTLDTSRTNLRFALGSCMDHKRHEPKIWQDFSSQKPDVFFLIGDSVYADKEADAKTGAPPEHLWKKFCEARATLEFYFLEHLVPTYAVWDDHDFGKNDSDGTYIYAKEALINFEMFFAQSAGHTRNYEKGPGCASVVTLGNQQMLLLDDRSFHFKDKSLVRYSQWGQLQEQWMLDKVASFRGLNWLFNGIQYVPNIPFKASVSSASKEQLRRVFEQLKGIKSKVVLGSGDVHYSEISELEERLLGYRSYEITSSGIHSRLFPGLPYALPNKRRIAATHKKSYVMVDYLDGGNTHLLSVTSHSKDGEVNFRELLRV